MSTEVSFLGGSCNMESFKAKIDYLSIILQKNPEKFVLYTDFCKFGLMFVTFVHKNYIIY